MNKLPPKIEAKLKERGKVIFSHKDFRDNSPLNGGIWLSIDDVREILQEALEPYQNIRQELIDVNLAIGGIRNLRKDPEDINRIDSDLNYLCTVRLPEIFNRLPVPEALKESEGGDEKDAMDKDVPSKSEDWREEPWQNKFLNAGTKELGIDCSVLIGVVSRILEAQESCHKRKIGLIATAIDEVLEENGVDRVIINSAIAEPVK